MARGYPDFFSIPIFPTKGIPVLDFLDPLVILAGAPFTAITAVGKGSVMGGWILITGTKDFANLYVQVTVDGASGYRFYPTVMRDSSIYTTDNQELYLIRLDYNYPAVGIGIGNIVDFGVSFAIAGGNLTADNITISAALSWFRVV